MSKSPPTEIGGQPVYPVLTGDRCPSMLATKPKRSFKGAPSGEKPPKPHSRFGQRPFYRFVNLIAGQHQASDHDADLLRYRDPIRRCSSAGLAQPAPRIGSQYGKCGIPVVRCRSGGSVETRALGYGRTAPLPAQAGERNAMIAPYIALDCAAPSRHDWIIGASPA